MESKINSNISLKTSNYNKLPNINKYARISLALFILSMFLFPQQVYSHFYGHFTGLIGSEMITGEWSVVALNILFFVTFLIPLSYRSRASWKRSGLVTAFFISLFIEMYGIPFTVLFASNIMTPSSSVVMTGALNISFAGVSFVYTIPMIYGTLLMIAGTIIIAYAWYTLYTKSKTEQLVTSGIYGFSRHPQYLGFLLVIIGWMIGWPTIMTLIFGSILIVMYIRVCKKEEIELSVDTKYNEYMESTPFMI